MRKCGKSTSLRQEYKDLKLKTNWICIHIYIYTYIHIYIYIECGPLPVTVTTRIITFLIGDPYKPLLATVTGRGPYPTYIHIYIYTYIHIYIYTYIHIYIYTYIHIYIYISNSIKSRFHQPIRNKYVCYIYIYIHNEVSIYLPNTQNHTTNSFCCCFFGCFRKKSVGTKVLLMAEIPFPTT